MNWFSSKVEGSAFAKVSSNQALLDAANGKLLALESLHDRHTDATAQLSKNIDVWHVKLDNSSDAIKVLLDKL